MLVHIQQQYYPDDSIILIHTYFYDSNYGNYLISAAIALGFPPPSLQCQPFYTACANVTM